MNGDHRTVALETPVGLSHHQARRPVDVALDYTWTPEQGQTGGDGVNAVGGPVALPAHVANSSTPTARGADASGSGNASKQSQDRAAADGRSEDACRPGACPPSERGTVRGRRRARPLSPPAASSSPPRCSPTKVRRPQEPSRQKNLRTRRQRTTPRPALGRPRGIADKGCVSGSNRATRTRGLACRATSPDTHRLVVHR